MSTSDPNGGLSRAAASAKQFRSGIARTLARGASPSQTQPRRLPVPFTASGGIASPQAFPLTQGGGVPQVSSDVGPSAAAPEAQRVPGRSGGGEQGGTRRSQTQMAAIFARAVAQGQRNL